MLTWARAPLLPQQTPPPPSCPPGPWTGHPGTSREQVYPSLHKPCSWDQGPALPPKMRFNTDSSRKPSRLIHKGLAVLTHTQP